MNRDSGKRTGLWLVGGRGSVATTAALGIAALSRNLAEPVGLATESAQLRDLPMPALSDLIVGGHDVGTTPLADKARALSAAGMIDGALVASVADDLSALDENILPVPTAPTQAEEIELRAADIAAFRERNGLDRVVVIDVSSTEPLPAYRSEFEDRSLLEAALATPGDAVLPPSSLGALAAVTAGAAYACFTPSTSLNLPVLWQWATDAGIPFAGQDGKTGETLLRTVLAPMFTSRGMKVRSWAGTNLLGGGDGQTLADPEAVRSKLASKNRGLHALLGPDVVAPLHIDNVPDLGDVKTAWDHVSAEGFLGSRVILQTTWSAYDSMLAAPLVIDLARLLSLAQASGESGPVGALGFFFKDPWGSDVHAFADQTNLLTEWAQRVASRLPVGTP
ncbi:myo-inositol-1-phosphate synthase [Microbacteriaceae bacterium SG_E_30_P1]|uniref:Myo-inositol-1-phosphate synthase n=1 Tax=Antiquaquibacter oligotrophicus TaxID=2880260 RepID=A0ABT6KKV5_9MICO|nr:inositol-3-phosphate synthase [Antiquaquibacter oligotrophicus]MDH6180637.1 myo-inositol-1-phosphate synthase [Antiquaquibacter oligotrophicus]UDF13634.1 inositol-3-phosphate synthase [Antiquaquibacter oligotrophicus]